MYKTLGGYSWTALFYEGADPIPTNNTVTGSLDVEGMEQYQMAWENLKMVSYLIFTIGILFNFFGHYNAFFFVSQFVIH